MSVGSTPNPDFLSQDISTKAESPAELDICLVHHSKVTSNTSAAGEMMLPIREFRARNFDPRYVFVYWHERRA